MKAHVATPWEAGLTTPRRLPACPTQQHGCDQIWVGQTSVCGGLQIASCGAEAPRRLKPAPPGAPK
jgi:hypothetical protein